MLDGRDFPPVQHQPQPFQALLRRRSRPARSSTGRRAGAGPGGASGACSRPGRPGATGRAGVTGTRRPRRASRCTGRSAASWCCSGWLRRSFPQSTACRRMRRAVRRRPEARSRAVIAVAMLRLWPKLSLLDIGPHRGSTRPALRSSAISGALESPHRHRVLRSAAIRFGHGPD